MIITLSIYFSNYSSEEHVLFEKESGNFHIGTGQKEAGKQGAKPSFALPKASSIF
jgi:hypothetical protein